MIGWPDGECAFLHTGMIGDEVIVTGEMINWVSGSIYLKVRTDPGYTSYVVVSTTDNADKDPEQWELIKHGNGQGYTVITNTDLDWVYVGSAQASYKYISINCYGGAPGFQLLENHVYIDSVSESPWELPPPPWPPQPDYYPVTVNICDNFGNSLVGDIYIDGDYAGQTSVTQYVLNSAYFEGPHEISIENVGNYAFQNFTVNGDTEFDYPLSVEVYGPVTVTVYFGPPPPPVVYHSVMVDWYAENADQYFNPDGYNVLYIDGLYGYSLGWPYSLVEGTHTFKLDDYIDLNYCYYEFLYFTCDGNTYYSNTITLPVTSDKTITAHYYLHWYY